MKFNQLLKQYEAQIDKACVGICKGTKPHKIEVEDLKQEALIKLWQLSTVGIVNEKTIMSCIRNHIIDYIRHEKLNPLTSAISLDSLLENI